MDDNYILIENDSMISVAPSPTDSSPPAPREANTPMVGGYCGSFELSNERDAGSSTFMSVSKDEHRSADVITGEEERQDKQGVDRSLQEGKDSVVVDLKPDYQCVLLAPAQINALSTPFFKVGIANHFIPAVYCEDPFVEDLAQLVHIGPFSRNVYVTRYAAHTTDYKEYEWLLKYGSTELWYEKPSKAHLKNIETQE
ncbi:hypothetical protein Alg130_04695, partial [Pyrenophora tritici-repentis]